MSCCVCSFGEFRSSFKGDLVIAEPDVTRFPLADDVEFVVLACDGLYEGMGHQEVSTEMNACGDIILPCILYVWQAVQLLECVVQSSSRQSID
jgi:hypothetical protein